MGVSVAAARAISRAVMLSSELPELLALSDRILVMYEGAIVAEMKNDDLSQETVLAAMMNQTRKAE